MSWFMFAGHGGKGKWEASGLELRWKCQSYNPVVQAQFSRWQLLMEQPICALRHYCCRCGWFSWGLGWEEEMALAGLGVG